MPVSAEKGVAPEPAPHSAPGLVWTHSALGGGRREKGLIIRTTEDSSQKANTAAAYQTAIAGWGERRMQRADRELHS